jgi:hypothetical protein
MSPNGRFITFLAPGEAVSGSSGTNRDGIFDRQSSKVVLAPGASAINNDGWFAVNVTRPEVDGLAIGGIGAVAAGSMSRLNDDGTISGPYQSHLAGNPRQFSGDRSIKTLDASLRFGAYYADLPTSSPYIVDRRDQAIPMFVDMVTGEEKSILDTNPDPSTHPTGGAGVTPMISPNGRYVMFANDTGNGPTQGVWDIRTGDFFHATSPYVGVVTNDGRLVGSQGGSVIVQDLKAGQSWSLNPYDPVADFILDTPMLFGQATDTNRLLTCTRMPYSRFDTNNQRDCYLLPLPAQP